MMEGAGNFSVKRKRNLDHLYISEIVVANNIRSKCELLHTFKTQKKKKKKEGKDELAHFILRNIFGYGKLERKN